MIARVVVALDEGLDLGFEIAWRNSLASATVALMAALGCLKEFPMRLSVARHDGTHRDAL